MNQNELPSIPHSLEGGEQNAPGHGLERVNWSDAEAEAREAMATGGNGSPAAFSGWVVGAAEALARGHRVAVTTVELRGLGSPELEPAAQRLDMDMASKVAVAIERMHAPEGGVAVNDESCLVFGLPDGASWVSVSSTIERALVEQGVPLSKVRVAFGIAEAGTLNQTLEDALRLSLKAATRAHDGNLGAVMMSLSDEALDGRDDEVGSLLANALEDGNGLRLVFQPKIDTGTQRTIGAEALLRFQCEVFGAIPPTEFFPIAQRMGLVEQLEDWVVERAVSDVAALAAEGELNVPVSFNVRGAKLLSDGFVERLQGLLEEYGVQGEQLRVEVSESDVVADPAAAEEKLTAIRKLGLTVALDDFGKEGTTLADLRQLPIDVLKVHRAFTREMEADSSSAALIQGVMSLSRALGIQTVAAGVESWSQFDALRAFGCGAVQGYLFSQPLERGAFGEHLAAAKCKTAGASVV